jgi:hypothetical protein
VLVEFALVALGLYFLLAATLEFGRLFFSAQVLQTAADTGARELAHVPLSPTATFDAAMQDPVVRARIYSIDWLVVDLDTLPDLNEFFAGKPIINQQLRNLMILDTENGRRLLRYPGALVSDPGTPTGYSVRIPVINPDNSITWHDVVEEIRPEGATEGPFSLLAPSPNPFELRGFVALRINYPYQAATLSGYRANLADISGEPPNPNIDYPIEVNDATSAGTYTGSLGLGKQYVLLKAVRPYRKVISTQAIFRREVFQ